MAYSDISRGVRLAADYQKYLAWLQKDTGARQAAYAAVTSPANKVKVARVPGFIVPFTSSGASLVYLPSKLIAAEQPGRGGLLAKDVRLMVAGYTYTTTEVEALTTPNILESARKFKPAKLTVIERMTTSTVKEASRITGRLYYRHENDSVSAAFGKKLLNDTIDTAMTAIKATSQFGTYISDSKPLNRYKFTPEAL